MSTLRPLLDAILLHIEKAVLSVDAGGPGMAKFRLYRGEQKLSDEAGQTRVFDVVISDAVVDGPCIGAQSWDYDVTANIEIAYDSTRSNAAQIISDYDAIRDAIRASDKTDLNALGFGFFRFQDAPTQQQARTDDKLLFSIIPVLCRVTVEH